VTNPYLTIDVQTQCIGTKLHDLKEAKEMSDEISYGELEKLEDIIRMTSASMKPSPLHHIQIKD